MDDSMNSGFSSDPGMGSFKSANAISGKLPAGEGGSTVKSSENLEQRAGDYSMRHSVKGLSSGKPFTAKVKPMRNIGRDIGRKRGF